MALVRPAAPRATAAASTSSSAAVGAPRRSAPRAGPAAERAYDPRAYRRELGTYAAASQPRGRGSAPHRAGGGVGGLTGRIGADGAGPEGRAAARGLWRREKRDALACALPWNLWEEAPAAPPPLRRVGRRAGSLWGVSGAQDAPLRSLVGTSQRGARVGGGAKGTRACSTNGGLWKGIAARRRPAAP